MVIVRRCSPTVMEDYGTLRRRQFLIGAGNVLEWVADNYDSQYYAESITDDPLGPEFGDGKVLRGGSFGNTDGAFYTTTRRYHLPADTAEVDTGFRCAMTAP